MKVICVLIISLIIAILLCIFFNYIRTSDRYSSDSIMTIHPQKKYALVVLTRGYNKNEEYNNFIERCKLIKKQSWYNLYDHIVFHEGNITQKQQEWLKKETELDLRFIDIGESFNKFKKNVVKDDNNPYCKWHEGSAEGGSGYKAMCAFWFLYFTEYLRNYIAILRIDEDCTINGNIEDPNPGDNVKFATVRVEGMDWPEVTDGMVSLFDSFCKENNISWNKTWKSPYTNVMWVNMNFAKDPMVKKIQEMVKKSKCIEQNRWGDLPLWGATLNIMDIPLSKLKLPYFHGSHGMKIDY